MSLDRHSFWEGCAKDVTLSRQARCVSAQAPFIPARERAGPARDQALIPLASPRRLAAKTRQDFLSYWVGVFPRSRSGRGLLRPCFFSGMPVPGTFIRRFLLFPANPTRFGVPSRAGDSDRQPVSAGAEFHPQSSARDLLHHIRSACDTLLVPVVRSECS